jgi:putative FmdB family regulatory protein
MPTYEYECAEGCRFEMVQSIKDDALEVCTPEVCPCGKGGVEVRRVIQAAGFILKGGGWYADGYSSSKGKSSGNGAESGTSSSDGGSGGSSGSSGKTSESSSSGTSSTGKGSSASSSASS